MPIFLKSIIVFTLLFSPVKEHEGIMSPENYYLSLSPSLFQDFDEASLNIKKLIKYGDLPKIVPLLKNYRDRNLIMHLQMLRDNIPVNKLVYVFISIEMNTNNKRVKYIFIDSETNKPITKGSTWSKLN